MRVIAAARAMWRGITDPRRIREATTDTATAIFAVAVLLVGLTSAVCAVIEHGHPGLAAESARLTASSGTPAPDAAIDVSTPQRQFTAALGGALMVATISTAVLAGLFLVLMRFMTDAPVTYGMAITAVSATALIQIVDLLVSTGAHFAFGTVRAGLHAGVAVDPASAPMMFTWLQQISLASLWQYLAASVALATWGGLHARFGIVVGLAVWVVSRLIHGGFTLVGWILSL